MIRSAESFGQILPAVPESAIINFVSLFPSSAQQTEAKKHLHTGCVVMKGGKAGKGNGESGEPPLQLRAICMQKKWQNFPVCLPNTNT